MGNTDICDENIRKYAVVLNRPPGHHCDGSKYSGYCYINNTALAIEKELNMDTKVLVLDVDVHHGDGTQKLFYAEPTVLTVSFHQFDGTFFPISGSRTEYGPSRRHAAYGTNINVPLCENASDLDVLYALRNMVWNIVQKFEPKIAFLSLGTDGVAGDKANNSTIFTPSLYGQIAFELQQYVQLIVVTTEGGYTTKYLANGMNCVLHGLTGQINANHYPLNILANDVLNSTVHTVAATISDLRRVYEFERDPMEIEKIFNGSGNNSNSLSLDQYIPPNDEEDDIEYNEMLDDEEMFDTKNENKKKDENENEERHKKKKKKKRDKHKKDAIDLTIKNEENGEDVCHHKKKKSKKKKKHKKKRDKHKKKERKNVSKTVEKKQEKNKKDDDGDTILTDNELLENKEVISLISPSPMIIEKNQNEKKRKRKRRKRKKSKSKEVLDMEIKNNDLKEGDENGSDVHNVNLGEMNSLSIVNDDDNINQSEKDLINGNGIADKSNDDEIIVID